MVINRGVEKNELTIPVWQAVVPMQCEMEQLLYSYTAGYSTDCVLLPVDEGSLTLYMDKNAAAILRYKK